jgi:hypothetical protein
MQQGSTGHGSQRERITTEERPVIRAVVEAFLILLVLFVAACGEPVSWQAHAAIAPKPGTQLRAPSDQALLIVIVKNAQATGTGAYAVFERDGMVAQFDDRLAAWTVKALKPGLHRLYVRAAASDSCARVDADLREGKIYVLDLNAKDAATWETPGKENPAGALADLPYVALDAGAADRELVTRASQVRDCIEHADAKAKARPHDAGYEQIDFMPRENPPR